MQRRLRPMPMPIRLEVQGPLSFHDALDDCPVAVVSVAPTGSS
jgi:hypothetical protein